MKTLTVKQSTSSKKRETDPKAAAAAAPTTTTTTVKDTAAGRNDNRNRGGVDAAEARGGSSRGGGRGGGGKGGRREFDRHSATGRVDSEKAVEQGWGKLTDGQMEPPAEDEEAAKEEGEDNEAKQEQEPAPAPEPELPTFTLDEYLSERAQRIALGSLPSARKPSTSDLTPLQAKPEETYYSGTRTTTANNPPTTTSSNTTKKSSNKITLDIEQRFAPDPRQRDMNTRRSPRNREYGDGHPQREQPRSADQQQRPSQRGGRGGSGRGGSERGGRGGSDRGRGGSERGGRGRGGSSRGGGSGPPYAHNAAAAATASPGVNINDSRAFPSLGKA